ncbi:hypothetical protein PLICRDRAFT_340772 [Plicaturopsis crispa FD-325 SS-3]|uniref:SMODS and SLOG-associating 2TM effector domain-containing protein n=1 Tax=Plicaturopsis crispa FD-325 SS-3 TaxID=944288 RepID=A0A0C9SY32_PLICR|nr:hypothetical protein PLICRDRAFT_340772 [Plicaturopsis crispa FD-325 SS-3]
MSREHEHDLPTLPDNASRPTLTLTSTSHHDAPTNAPTPMAERPIQHPHPVASPVSRRVSLRAESPTISSRLYPAPYNLNDIETGRQGNASPSRLADESNVRDSGVGGSTRVPRASHPPGSNHDTRPLSPRRSTTDAIHPPLPIASYVNMPPSQPRSIQDRLEPTLDVARRERNRYAKRAKATGYALNIAIGLQVVIGALITGLSAVTVGRQTSIMTAIMGGFSSIVASYLARARGSNEPELSIQRCKDLEQFIRECEAFQLDKGHLNPEPGSECEEEKKLVELRDRFEELLGNANGERRMATP